MVLFLTKALLKGVLISFVIAELLLHSMKPCSFEGLLKILYNEVFMNLSPPIE
jgi:hypothetical protein